MKPLATPTISALLLLTPWVSRAQAPLARIVDETGKSDEAKKVYAQHVAEQVERGYQELLGWDYLNAARDLQWALAMGAEHPEEVREALGQAKRKIATLSLSFSEPGAVLIVDGEHVAGWPALYGGELYLSPGQHRIQVTKREFVPYEALIEVGAGEERMISVALAQEGYELYPKILGIPTQVNMSVEAKMGPQPEAPTWQTKMMIGGFIGLSVGTGMVVTGALMIPNDPTTWRGVAVSGGVLGALSLGVIGIGWVSKPAPPQPPIIVQPVMTNQTTGVSVSGHW